MTTIKYINPDNKDGIIEELQQKLVEYEKTIKAYNDNTRKYTKEDAQLCAKIQRVKQKLLNANLKMTGKNTFNHYNYFDLKDITPTITSALIEEGLSSRFYVIDDVLYLHIIDNDTGHYMQWDTPLKAPTQSQKNGDVGQYMKLAQSLHTYGRRTLWLLALEIVEAVTLEQTTPHTNRTQKGHRKDTERTPTKHKEVKPVEPQKILDKITKEMEENETEINIENTDKELPNLLDADKINKQEYDQVLKMLEFGAVENDKGKNN